MSQPDPATPVLTLAGERNGSTAFPKMLGSKTLVRNTLLNLGGQVVTIGVGAAALPLVVRGLGVEQFGLLSLIWVVLGYVATLDLGLGAAATKYVAEALGKGDDALAAKYVGSSFAAQVVLAGVLGGAMLAGAPLLVGRVLNVSPDSSSEATAAFRVLALGIPLVMLSNTLMAALQGAHRFDLMNGVRVPTTAAMYLLPLVGVWTGLSLMGIVVLILISRAVALVGLLVMCARAFPRWRLAWLDWRPKSVLFRYGGWLAVLTVVDPVLAYADRFVLGALVSTAAVGYYAVSSELVLRLSFLPAALAITLFPAFSALDSMNDQHRLGMLFSRSLKYTLLVLGPIVIFVVLYAHEILQAWLGTDFADRGATVLRILAVGALINYLQYVPINLLKGLARLEFVAKVHVIELPPYLVLMWFATLAWGLPGAASVWSARMAVDGLILFWAAASAARCSVRVLWLHGLVATMLAFLVLAAATILVRSATTDFPELVQAGLSCLLILVFIGLAWSTLLDRVDRSAVLRAVRVWQHEA